jgi:hypothetical protein
MIGVPAASAATTLLLFVVGALVVGAGLFVLRRRLTALPAEARLVAAAVALSLVAAPWVAWRFVEDVRTTTRYDAYERSNAGPIQAYLPGYLVDGARSIPARATWAAIVGPSGANPVAQKAFPALVLTTLFPRVSAPPARAEWIVGFGADPRSAGARGPVRVVHAPQAGLPSVLLARRRP